LSENGGKKTVGVEKWEVHDNQFSLVYQKRIKDGKVYSYSVLFVPDIFFESMGKMVIFDAK